jgi:outer membrane protein assembly factor BamD (BamD/ComL family)
MPQHLKKFGASWFLIFVFIFTVFAQAPQTPSAAEVMRERINKVKALMALKSYSAAIYELEGIRRQTNDSSVVQVVQVMLMNCYLEQADYKRAQSLLTELYSAQKAGKPNANYYAVAAQVVKGARNQLERYKSLGLTVSDPTLPQNAVMDLNKMRETVESVVDQAKTLGAN